MMGKRSNFERRERDFYPTPYGAVVPLLPHLSPHTHFIEPCAGDGTLVNHLEIMGYRCVLATDIEPRHEAVSYLDALKFPATFFDIKNVDCFITNPPWDRKILHPLIEHLPNIAPTWLLFDADWMHTKQAAPYLPRLRKIVSVGRVKWIPDSKMTGKDNCCWYLFKEPSSIPTTFYGRR